jgi:hypothetical protein
MRETTAFCAFQEVRAVSSGVPNLWLLKNLSRRSTALQSDMLLAEWSVF